MVDVTGPGTPYINPAMLTAAPTGISWSTIPDRTATPEQKLAEQLNLCSRATAMVDECCNTTLRCTANAETLYGPDYRVTTRTGGVTRVMLARPPVTQVLGGRVSSAASFPPQWTDIPADQWQVEQPLIGVYGTSSPSDTGDGGQVVLLAPGYVDWSRGRNGYMLLINYLNGWPHAGLTAPAPRAGDMTLAVDDCTGWAPAGPGLPGATGIIFDGGQQEAITVTAATASTGPGTLTLAAPIAYAHQPGTVVSTLPEAVQWATILMASGMALTRGATATTIQSVGGKQQASRSPEDLMAEARLIIHPFRRVL
ncbi:hypothetical protein GCM10023196_036940 [Actinoallomurus vinaceus]|uniref:Uncharacterized protein n=1 Tax=Actinoallomurus vinaceus TaxID=1080074 RepID=A0ABP8UB11_9ACTN